MKYLVIIILAVLALVASVLMGPGLDVSTSASLWMQRISGEQINGLQAALLDYRLWRALTAMFVGAGLGMAGMLLQAVLANPLADPYILGISSGAGAGVSVATLLGLPAAVSFLGGGGNILAGLIGAGVAMLVVVSFAGRVRPTMAGSLVIVGVMTGSFLSSIAMLALSMTPGREQGQVLLWMLGDLGSPNHSAITVLFLAIVVLPVTFVAVWRRRELDMLLAGEESAFLAGTNVVRWRIIFIVMAALATTAAVVVAGTIGFVGLFVPHLARLWLGARHARLTIGVLILGSMIVLVADTLSRVLINALSLPALPCGVITALIGAPYFLFVLRRKVWAKS